MTQTHATYLTQLGITAMATIGGMTLAALLYKFLKWLDDGRKQFAQGWNDVKPGIEDRYAGQHAKVPPVITVAEEVFSVRCPICRSPEGVTCNPELAPDMAYIWLGFEQLTHALRIVKAVNLEAADRNDVLTLLPHDEVGDQLREQLAYHPAHSA